MPVWGIRGASYIEFGSDCKALLTGSNPGNDEGTLMPLEHGKRNGIALGAICGAAFLQLTLRKECRKCHP